MEISQSITRKSASNLAMAFILLPKEKRLAMSALYAFCRAVDDVADDESTSADRRRRELQSWREEVRSVFRGEPPRRPILQEFQPVILEYQLPLELLEELLLGVEMDLDIKRYATYEDLELYCYRVASVVGLLSIEIFGYQDPRCRDYAIHLGKALQLTNILRDVRNDAERGRIYLPETELKRFGVPAEEIFQSQYSHRFRELGRSVAQKARAFYLKARETLPEVDRASMASAELMGSVYWRLLQKLEGHEFRVFDSAVTRLSKSQKLFLILRSRVKAWTGALSPNYGAG